MKKNIDGVEFDRWEQNKDAKKEQSKKKEKRKAER